MQITHHDPWMYSELDEKSGVCLLNFFEVHIILHTCVQSQFSVTLAVSPCFTWECEQDRNKMIELVINESLVAFSARTAPQAVAISTSDTKDVLFGSFGLSAKEPCTIMFCPSCVVVGICAYLPLP